MTDTVEAILKSVQTLPQLVMAFEALAATTVGAMVLAIFLFIYLLTKVPQLALVQSMQKKKAERRTLLEEYLANPSRDPSCEAVVKDQRDGQIFEIATGINAEKKWRDGLVDLHNRSNVTWLEMRRAWRYMDFEGANVLQIRKFTGWVRAEKYYNYFMALGFVMMGTFTFILAAIQPPSSSALLAFLLSAALFAMAIWAVTQNLPMAAADKIRSRAAATAVGGASGGAGGAGGGSGSGSGGGAAGAGGAPGSIP